MSNIQTAALDRLVTAIHGMTDFEKGRLIGIGEGMILARIGAAEDAQERQRAVLGLTDRREVSA